MADFLSVVLNKRFSLENNQIKGHDWCDQIEKSLKGPGVTHFPYESNTNFIFNL